MTKELTSPFGSASPFGSVGSGKMLEGGAISTMF